MTTAIFTYYPSEYEEPLTYVFDWENNETLIEITEKYLLPNIEPIDFNNLVIQQSFEEYVSPQLKATDTLKNLLDAELIQLSVHKKPSDDDIEQLIRDLQNADQQTSSQKKFKSSSITRFLDQTAPRLSEMVKADSMQLNIPRLRAMSRMDSFSSAISSNEQPKKNTAMLAQEYSWQYQKVPKNIYCDKGPNRYLSQLQDALMASFGRKIFVTCAIEIELIHSLQFGDLVDQVQTLIGFQGNINNSFPGSILMTLVRDTFGGWVILFVSLDKKGLSVHSAIPICCRFLLEPLVYNSQQELAALQYDDAVVRIASGDDTVLNRKKQPPPFLYSDDEIPEFMNEKKTFLIYIDGLCISIKCDMPSAVNLNIAANIALNEICGDHDQQYGSSLPYEDLIKNRMLCLKLFDDIQRIFVLNYQEIFNDVREFVTENYLSILNSPKEIQDVCFWLFKVAMLSTDNLGKFYNELIGKLSSAPANELEEILNILEQYTLYPTQLQTVVPYIKEQALQSIIMSVEEENDDISDFMTKMIDRLKLFAQQIPYVAREQLYQRQKQPTAKNPPPEIMINEDQDIEQLLDPDQIQYNTYSLCIFGLTPNMQLLKPINKTICSIEDFSLHNSEIMSTFLHLLPDIVHSKCSINNIPKAMNEMVRLLRNICEQEDIQIVTSLPQISVFNKKPIYRIYKKSTAIIFCFTKSMRLQGQVPYEYEQMFINTYGKPIDGNQKFLSYIPNNKPVNIGDRYTYFLIVLTAANECAYHIQLLVNPENSMPHIEIHDEIQHDVDRLFININYIDHDKQLLSTGDSKIFLVVAKLHEQPENLLFQNLNNIALTYIKNTNPNVFQQLVAQFVLLLKRYDIDLIEEDPVDELKRVDEFSPQFYTQSAKLIENYKNFKEIKLTSDLVKFQSQLIRYSPFYSLIEQQNITHELNDNEILCFLSETFENSLLRDNKMEACILDDVPEELVDVDIAEFMYIQNPKVKIDVSKLRIDTTKFEKDMKIIGSIVFNQIDHVCDSRTICKNYVMQMKREYNIAGQVLNKSLNQLRNSNIKLGEKNNICHWQNAVYGASVHFQHIFSQFSIIQRAIDFELELQYLESGVGQKLLLMQRDEQEERNINGYKIKTGDIHELKKLLGIQE
ncbi:Hypothetical_protein [Hexamita inflata]|uniref:Hypothetical_protein n=1 Tax=Hexamita inflata TaxID=28002 RepID=A0AA86UQK2_9EUKA|nr:Hypothetical protein HINF_LOCUS55425 [Hexamita inflata]